MGVRGISGSDVRLTPPAADEALAARQPPPEAAPAEPSPPTDNTDKAQRTQPSPTRETVRDMSHLLDEILKSLNWNIRIRIDEDADRIVTQIVDPEKNEIIKQIPPQELLDIMSRLKKVVGLLLDREA